MYSPLNYRYDESLRSNLTWQISAMALDIVY